MPEIAIDNRKIGPGYPPFIVAEMSANHGGSLERAKRIVRMSAAAGADSIKFQAYTPESMTLDCDKRDFIIEGPSLWEGSRLYDLYTSAQTPYEWFPELFELARSLGIIPFATPFDVAAVAMLESLDVPAFKIASFEAVDNDLISACAKTGKPIIISTGMCTQDEIQDALVSAQNVGANGVALLKCTSAYPASLSEANLVTIPAMAKRFQVPIGISDHTLGTTVAVAACTLGACIVEKHVIDSRTPVTPDSPFSLSEPELQDLVTQCKDAQRALGGEYYGPTEGEKQSIRFRRSLYALKDIHAGDILSRDSVGTIRPGFGLPPKHLDDVLNRIARVDIARGTPLSWDLIVDSSKN